MTIRYKTWSANEILTANDLISYAENNGVVQITATAELDSLDAGVNMALNTTDWILYKRTSSGTGAGKFTAVKDVTETLTGKTLTSPTINTPAVSGGTLTSPTINGATINAASTLGGVSGTTIAGWNGAWQAHSGVAITQSVAVTTQVNYSKYIQIGKTVHFNFSLTAKSTGSGGNRFRVSLPVTSSVTNIMAGPMVLLATTGWFGMATIDTSTTVALQVTSGYHTSQLNINDMIYGSVTYEAA